MSTNETAASRGLNISVYIPAHLLPIIKKIDNKYTSIEGGNSRGRSKWICRAIQEYWKKDNQDV